jgi:hypothetical protein
VASRVARPRSSSPSPTPPHCEQGVLPQTHDGLAVVGKTIQLKPGETVTLDDDMVTGRGQPGVPVLRVTRVRLGKIVTGTPSRCSRSRYAPD